MCFQVLEDITACEKSFSVSSESSTLSNTCPPVMLLDSVSAEFEKKHV